jgi:hypothetical protein
MYRGAHSVLEHRLGATSVAAFITKRAALLPLQRAVRDFCGRRLWRGPSAAEGESLGWLLGRAACDAEYGLPRIPSMRSSESSVPAKFTESPFYELRQITFYELRQIK